MTGTPLDLTPFGTLLKGIGITYWLIVVAALALVLWKVKGWVPKLLGCSVVLTVLVLPVAVRLWERIEKEDEARAKLDASMALFRERCRNAGEKILRTVENVDGLMWMKWREPISNADNFSDQFKLNDPYGQDCEAKDCIAMLLRVTEGAALNPEEAARHRTGYQFVETIDPKDGQRYRYRGVIKLRPIWTVEAIAREKKLTGKDIGPSDHFFTIERQSIEEWTTRYGITWDDISTREDREHWIAGGSLKVVDLQTNEVVAERVGYMMDRGQGSQAGFRSPWLMARRSACPSFKDGQRSWPNSETYMFASKVLRPSNGE